MSVLIRSILEKKDFVKPLSDLLEQNDLHKQLATMLFVSSQAKCQTLTENIAEVVAKFPKIYSIIAENKICLPEEESEVEKTVSFLTEEMTTAAAIDASTPRIKTKQTVTGDEEDVELAPKS